MLSFAGPSASASTYSPSMPLRSFLPQLPPMMRASTYTERQLSMETPSWIRCSAGTTHWGSVMITCSMAMPYPHSKQAMCNPTSWA